jgi:hypothetical protein
MVSSSPRSSPHHLLEADVEKALNCGALVEAKEPVKAWSPMFSVLQKDKTRLIFDLRGLNACLGRFPFSLETLAYLPALAHGCRFASKLDLQSAYWQYGVDAALSQHLGTSPPSQPHRLLQWTCLPFGISVAPFAFASLTAAFVRAWRAGGLIVSAYLDDIIVFGRTIIEHARSVQIVVEDLIRAGLRISPSKAFVWPYVSLEYLGMGIELRRRAFFLTPKCISNIVADAKSLLEVKGCAALRNVQRLLGRIAFASLAIPWLSTFLAHLAAATSSDSSVLELNDGAREELSWWVSDAALVIMRRLWPWTMIATTKLYARWTSAPVPQWRVHGDASNHGIGLRLRDGHLTSEPLPPELPPTSSSTCRELYAMVRLIEREVFPRGAVVRLLSDSTAAVRTAMGASISPAAATWARRLFLAALEKDICVQFEWVPRECLQDVDAASRWDASDMSHARYAHEEVEKIISEAFGAGTTIDLELFTSVHNRVGTGRFASRYPVPHSAGDGLDPHLWRSARTGWAFPPFAIVRPVLRLAVTLEPRVVLVLPDNAIIRATLRNWRRIPMGAPLAPPNFTERVRGACSIAAFLPPPQRDTCTLSEGSVLGWSR